MLDKKITDNRRENYQYLHFFLENEVQAFARNHETSRIKDKIDIGFGNKQYSVGKEVIKTLKKLEVLVDLIDNKLVINEGLLNHNISLRELANEQSQQRRYHSHFRHAHSAPNLFCGEENKHYLASGNNMTNSF